MVFFSIISTYARSRKEIDDEGEAMRSTLTLNSNVPSVFIVCKYYFKNYFKLYTMYFLQRNNEFMIHYSEGFLY